MNNLMVFEGQSVEIINVDGEILFELYSTGIALGYTKEAKGKKYAQKDRIEKVVENAGISTVVHGVQQYLTEEMLYDFMLEARTEKCKQFRKWVTNEVIPSIRKHGAYMTEQTIEEALTNPDFLIQLATKLKEEKEARKQLEEKIEEQKPLVTFAETCIKSKDNILIRELAKICCDEGISIGEKRLYNKMREWGMIMKKSTEPYQRFVESKHLVVEEKSINTPYRTRLVKTTKVSPKGQIYIIEKLKKENNKAN